MFTFFYKLKRKWYFNSLRYLQDSVKVILNFELIFTAAKMLFHG